MRAVQTGSGADSGNAHGQPQQQQVPQQTTQYRVARISDESPTRVFDLRSTPTNPAGSIKVVQQFFIGDDSSEYVNGHVNVVFEPLPDGKGDPRSILLDSGADASIFPLEFARSGTASSAAKMKLHDAQGREILVICMRNLEISLLDQHSQLILDQGAWCSVPSGFPADTLLWKVAAEWLGRARGRTGAVPPAHQHQDPNRSTESITDNPRMDQSNWVLA